MGSVGMRRLSQKVGAGGMALQSLLERCERLVAGK